MPFLPLLTFASASTSPPTLSSSRASRLPVLFYWSVPAFANTHCFASLEERVRASRAVQILVLGASIWPVLVYQSEKVRALRGGVAEWFWRCMIDFIFFALCFLFVLLEPWVGDAVVLYLLGGAILGLLVFAGVWTHLGYRQLMTLYSYMAFNKWEFGYQTRILVACIVLCYIFMDWVCEDFYKRF